LCRSTAAGLIQATRQSAQEKHGRRRCACTPVHAPPLCAEFIKTSSNANSVVPKLVVISWLIQGFHAVRSKEVKLWVRSSNQLKALPRHCRWMTRSDGEPTRFLFIGGMNPARNLTTGYKRRARFSELKKRRSKKRDHNALGHAAQSQMAERLTSSGGRIERVVSRSEPAQV